MVGNPPSPLPLHVPSKNDSGATAGWMDNGAGTGGSSPSISSPALTPFSLVRLVLAFSVCYRRRTRNIVLVLGAGASLVNGK